MYAKFYNQMEFTINMRKTWENGAPKIQLASGAIIEGPYEILAHFKFLAPIPIDFHKVDSRTQMPRFEFSETDVQPEVSFIKIHKEDVPKEIQEPGEAFDPKSVNWLKVKVSDLELMCSNMGINIDHLADKKPKEKKWELVKLVKAASGIN